VFLNEEGLGWAARAAHGFCDAGGLRVFAAEAYGQHAADVGVPGQSENQIDGVLIVITAGKADHVRVCLTLGHGVRDKLCALHGVHDSQDVADTLAAIVPQKPCHSMRASGWSSDIARLVSGARFDVQL
jgi:hypothetical protein